MGFQFANKELYMALILFLTIEFTEAVEYSNLNSTTVFRGKRALDCARSQFRCKNGQCINRLNMCDGEKQCADSSDEVFETCRTILCPDSGFTFRCNYGACLNRDMKCNGIADCDDGSDEEDCSRKDGCILPEHVKYGKFALSDGSKYIPNKVEQSSTTIFLFCDNDITQHQSLHYCLNAEWRPPIANVKCRKPGTCPSVSETISQEVTCKLREDFVSCEEPEANTTANIRCKQFYTYSGIKPLYKCLNGQWGQEFIHCNPDCGEKVVGAAALLVGADEAIKNEYPWVVAVYNASNEQICAGTVISRYFVLSAAHCFSTEEGKPLNKSDYTLIAGKHYRDINIEETEAQTRKVKNLYIHEDYRGRLQKFRDDIAVLELDIELTLSFQVQPICVDWESSYEDFDFIDGVEGVVTGWGNTHTAGEPSPVLRKLVVPFRNRAVCNQGLPQDFQQGFYSTDKICAGYKDKNKTACNGDSGGGLFFRSDRKKFYIRGIVSIAARSKVGCDSNNYALYTKVSKYLPWLEAKTRKIL